MIYLISFCGHTNDQRYLEFRSYTESEILSSCGVNVADGMNADNLTRIPNMWEYMKMGSSAQHFSPYSVITVRVPKNIFDACQAIDGSNEDEWDEYGLIDSGYNLDCDQVRDIVDKACEDAGQHGFSAIDLWAKESK